MRTRCLVASGMAAFLLVLSGCSGGKTVTPAPAAPSPAVPVATPSGGPSATASPDALANPKPGLCPVSNEEIDKDVTLVAGGKRYAFCCESCRKKFETNPQKYLTAEAGKTTLQLVDRSPGSGEGPARPPDMPHDGPNRPEPPPKEDAPPPVAEQPKLEFGKGAKHQVVVGKNWVVESAKSDMRLAQMRVPKTAGDAEDGELGFFMLPSGGGVEANINRWANNQFGGKDSIKARRTVKTASGLEATVVELEGNYTAMNFGGTKPAPKPGFKMLGAILKDKEGEYFFKLTGPKKTVEAAAMEFEQMVASYK